MADETPKSLWKRKKDEPTLWYQRFEIYRKMGTARSLRGCYRLYIQSEMQRQGIAGPIPDGAYETPPRGWKKQSLKWEWSTRAESFDDEEFLKDQEAEQKARDERRKKLIESVELSIESLALKTLEASQHLDAKTVTWNQYTTAAKFLKEAVLDSNASSGRSNRNNASGPDDGEGDTDLSFSDERAEAELSKLLTQTAIRKNYKPATEIREDKTAVDPVLDDSANDGLLQSG